MSVTKRKVIALLTGALLSLACGVRHEHVSQDFSQPLEREAAGPLRVNLFMMSGSVRLGAAPAERLYEGTLEYCQDHMSGSIELTPAGEGTAASLDVSVQGLPGVFLGFGGERNDLSLRLSRGVPLEMEVRLGSRESILDLSGLRIRTLDLKGGAGDMRLVFAEPNPIVARRISIDAMMGDISVDRLGNANASLTRIKGGLGSIEVDLSGPWHVPGRLVIEASVGDVLLKLPEAFDGRLRIGEPWSDGLRIPGFEIRDGAFVPAGGEAEPRVEVEVDAGIGGLTVETP